MFLGEKRITGIKLELDDTTRVLIVNAQHALESLSACDQRGLDDGVACMSTLGWRRIQ